MTIQYNKILSTGVLRREPSTFSSVVNIVNLDNNPQDVIVEVWDWSSYSKPVKLPVLIGNNEPVMFPYALQPNNLAVFFTFLAPENVTFYEVRVHYTGNTNVIINSFGRSTNLQSQEGDTVLQHEFVEITNTQNCDEDSIECQGGINNCLNRFTHIRLDNGRVFLMYITFIGEHSIAGFRLRKASNQWAYFGVDKDSIRSFSC